MRGRVRLRKTTALSCAVLAFVAVAVSCQEPTQVTVRITTGETCANLSHVQSFVGPSPLETQARFGRGFTTASSDRCDRDGLIGTLVITPGGDGGSILVAVGVRGGDGSPAPEATLCGDPELAKRCIVARRTFSFIEHKPLSLPIHLDPLCLGKTCDPASTCFQGSCVDANVVCNDADCGLVQENPGGGTGEGGANESGSSDGAYDADLDGPGFEDVGDAGLVDVMSSLDADATAVDTGIDAGTPLCSMGVPDIACVPGTFGTATSGGCGGDAGIQCCRCRCPLSPSMIVECNTSLGASCSIASSACP